MLRVPQTIEPTLIALLLATVLVSCEGRNEQVGASARREHASSENIAVTVGAFYGAAGVGLTTRVTQDSVRVGYWDDFGTVDTLLFARPIEVEAWEAIVDVIDRLPFDTLKNSYDNLDVADGKVITVTITSEGRPQRTFKAANVVVQALVPLVALVDSLVLPEYRSDYGKPLPY